SWSNRRATRRTVHTTGSRTHGRTPGRSPVTTKTRICCSHLAHGSVGPARASPRRADDDGEPGFHHAAQPRMAVRHVRPPADAAMTQADSFAPVLDAGRLRALVASVALAAAGYLAFSLWAGWHDVAAAVRRAGVGGVATLLGLSAANYLLRFVRWQLYLERLGTSVAWPRSMAIYLAGFALTTTPGKAGEAVRCLFLRRHGLPYTAGIAAFVSERLSDLTAIVAIACVGLAGHPGLWPLVSISLGACVTLSALLCAGDTLERLQARAAQSASRVAR